jgi:hypothetical protein
MHINSNYFDVAKMLTGSEAILLAEIGFIN